MTNVSRPVRIAYFTLALLLVAGILFQVYLVGLSLLGGQPSWETHVGLGHTLGIVALPLLLIAYFGRLHREDKRLNLLFIATYILQAEVFAVIRDTAPMLAAWHPVLALVMFATSVVIAWRAYGLLRVPAFVQAEEEMHSEADRAA